MQSVIGVVLATLTIILRGAAERHWSRGSLGPEAPCVREPPPAPAAKVEDIIRRARSESCVCELTCDSVERGARLVFIATVSICAWQSCILGLYCGWPLSVQELSSSLFPGRIVAIGYPGEDLWHERVVMGPGLRDAAGVVANWWTLTPDGDLYEEDISMEAGEGERLVMLDLAGSCPRALRGRFHRFAGGAYPSDDRVRREGPPALLDFVTEDGVLAPLSDVGRRLRRGGAAGVGGGGAGAVVVDDGAAAPEMPLPPEAAPPGGDVSPGAGGAVAPYLAVLPERPAHREGLVWLVTENADGHETLGMEVIPRAGDVVVTTADGVVYRRSSFLRVQAVPHRDCAGFARALRDVLTLWVDYGEVGERYKSWKKAAHESMEEPISAAEVQGPPGALHLARHVEQYGGDPRRWWQEFSRSNSIFKTDRVYHGMITLTESFKLFGECDQLNLGASAGIEKMVRRMLGVIDAYSMGGGAPSWRMAAVYEGEASCGDAIVPALRKWGVNKLKDQAEIESTRAPPTADEAAEAAVMQVGAGGAAEAPRPRRWGIFERLAALAPLRSFRWLFLGVELHLLAAAAAVGATVLAIPYVSPTQLDESLACLESLAELQVREGAREFYKPPEVALRGLLCEKASGYRMDASSTTLAPCQRGRVSLPEKRTGVPSVSDLIGDRGRYFLQGAGERMLDPTFSDSVDDVAERCSVNQQLASSPTLYTRFIRDLKARNMLVFGGWVHERTDFFHRKKNGKPRLILDARRANRMLFIRWTSRPGSRWFGLPPVRAADAGLTDTLDGPVGPDGMVTPMPRCLPMGFSWSLALAQDVDEEVASQVLSRAELLRDRGQPLVLALRGEAASDTRHYIYVDNIGVFGSDGSVVASKLEDVCAAFEARGLAVHGVATSGSGVEALGVLLDGRRRHARLTATRFWRVRGALLALAGRRRATGRQVEIVLGHATFCGLVRRETLSVFATVYPLIKRHYDQPAPLCWGSDWNPLVVATDASETGYGICTRWFAAEDVAAVGRCRERDRYPAEGRVGARAAALGAEPPPCEPLDVEGCADLQPDPHFAEVPSCMTDRAAWTVVGGWKFEQPEDIMALEARGMLRGLERVSRARKRRLESLLGPSASLQSTARVLKAEGELGVADLARSACESGLADSEVRLILEQLNGLIRTDPRSREASSSDREGEATAAARQRALPRGRKDALTKLLASEALPELSHLTLGEHAAVRPRTEAQYAQEVHQFSLFCGVARATEISIEDLDDLLVQHIDRQIKSGVTAARGMKLLAGVVHARPKAGRQGPRTLRRSWRALKGWQNLCPSTSRLPEAWPIWRAIVNGLCGMGRCDMALFICLMWSTCARPIQLMVLKPECMYAPSRVATYWTVQLNPEVDGVPSKAKEFDVTIALLAAAVQKVARDLGFNLAVYQARRSGASADMASRRRTLAEVKKRGGWKSDRSVVRYEKGARSSSTRMVRPSWLRQHAAQREEQFVEILVHGRDSFA
ncbi:unnamed protein product [Prorocentrum cordatum]|uniref:Uncharacterized protein n=1 Tax=Prorocentrum cordatum TaxID=2364126 RepID=A0ABN9STN9_9DINO|nr:unnamed protein product [Polarella glacialis]